MNSEELWSAAAVRQPLCEMDPLRPPYSPGDRFGSGLQ